ncbi:methyltransferase domain-containing protein [Pseudomonas aeruginosa]|uniref:methyltransferase domain-containing protein n=1 Tax=Pseudomonas aeruginosa TaxID=287 RepID=UPI000EB1BF27|nr:methyltransferase domain-containing protein [Pseudomonas aeruginosa]ELV1374420.1 methyltransferase domain-containing protein [Pseudomonas aeruginosa]MCX3418221.1 methyltransferase domain-containing protein [Pseudomonas aeruginosa]MDE9770668.1 methyltransferase domain-containing protein [Pseudomonas aeruginosa]TSC48392.1 methyltransferase domain-containing protein [Pseudomonas aeruginosa]HBO3125456.1 methyltransferase domain-containing protein [Pseudomonas aeruginosa]
MRESVQNYYGKILQTTGDLKTSACCDVSGLPDWLKPLLANVHPEVSARYYGCGLVAPALLEGCRVLDLGSGAGRDCYVLAQLVGPQGSVLGVDMTAEQLAVANAHRAYHAERFGFANVAFRQGYIEDLAALELADASFDVIVSNCVINLSPDKDSVLREAYRLLKPGGELYFSDVYADRRLADALRQDEVLYGECLGGALYWNDFEHLARRRGFSDPRLVEDRPISVDDPALAEKLGDARFFSATYRLFKLDGLEPACEDYGQAVIYRGSMPGAAHAFVLDKHHRIETGRVFPVCGNTWRMLKDTRFAPHFQFIGDFSRHFGLFEGCGGRLPFDQPIAAVTASSCC